MRYVRTEKRNGDNVLPKSPLIIPGHLDPANAATTSWAAVQIAVTIAVSLHMSLETLDASAAILSGMPTDRSIHIRTSPCAYRELENVQINDPGSFSTN